MIFKYHRTFVKEKAIQSFLYPSVCFGCRKSFKKPKTLLVIICPECDGNLIQLSRKFKAPKKSNKSEWNVVKFVVNSGFFYQTIYSGNSPVKYPKTLTEAEVFVEKHKRK